MAENQKPLLRILVVEDSEFDAQMMISLIRKSGYDVASERVETVEAYEAALTGKAWDVILADYNLPTFSAPDALAILQQTGLDLPFIIVSGGIGEATAVAAMKAGAQDYFANAAAFPDHFYGQLALERLGRPVPAPIEPDYALITQADRDAFDARDVVRAARILGQLGDWTDQTQFLRVIGNAANLSDADHLLAAQLSRELQRPDLGVMAERAAKPESASDYVRSGFPVLPVPSDIANSFSFIHGIMRQESQFDRQAVSSTGARGMMQLMPGTAREQADKLGLSYDYSRLTSDPGYNMQLGTAYFGRIMDMFGGNYVLAIAAYNAGPGNVRKWIAQYGDPRSGGVDPIAWIEQIPFSETRGYVQNVLENVVVYDTLTPARAGPPAANRLSFYLGKRTQG